MRDTEQVGEIIRFHVSGRKFTSIAIQLFNYEWGLFNSPNLLLFPEPGMFLN